MQLITTNYLTAVIMANSAQETAEAIKLLAAHIKKDEPGIIAKANITLKYSDKNILQACAVASSKVTQCRVSANEDYTKWTFVGPQLNAEIACGLTETLIGHLSHHYVDQRSWFEEVFKTIACTPMPTNVDLAIKEFTDDPLSVNLLTKPQIARATLQ